MTISFSTLFSRIGHHEGGANEANSFRGTTLQNRFTTINSDYASSDQSLVNTIWSTLESGQGSIGSTLTAYQALAQATLIRMVVDDKPLISQTLSSCATELYNQMVANSQSILRPTVTMTATTGTNVGDTVCVVSPKLGDGRQCDMAFAETINLLCTADAYTGGGTAYAEPFSYNGAAAVTELSWLWPGGSGATGSVNATNAATDAFVREGDFEGTWNPANTPPTPWVVTTGVVGTTVLQGATVLRGTKSLRIAGNSAELTKIRQPLTGLRPQTPYAMNLWYALSAGSPAAGVMAFRLVDGSGTVIADSQGTNNTASVTLSGVANTNWHALNFTARLPSTLPSQIYLEITLTTALSTGTSVFVDLVQMVQAQTLYTMGPNFALFSGGTQATRGDSFSIAVANSGGVTNFSRTQDRLLGLRNVSIQLPSVTSGETQADSKIV